VTEIIRLGTQVLWLQVPVRVPKICTRVLLYSSTSTTPGDLREENEDTFGQSLNHCFVDFVSVLSPQ